MALVLRHSTSQEEFQAALQELADELLNKRIIVVDTGDVSLCKSQVFLYRLIEVEAYLYTSDNSHQDPFCHCKEEQKQNTCWYFHRQGRAMDSFKGGTRKGLDITFGHPLSVDNPTDLKREQFGGFLIRSIQNSQGKIIEGPST
ncbi:hypothetical protein HK096_001335, partial [Nowakowskiella sp. JEL0078]